MHDDFAPRPRAPEFPPNDWDAIREHYAYFLPRIMAEARDEWAFDPYLWDNGMLRMTPIEAWLWADLREVNAIVYPQFPVGGVFVDFANPVAKVAIECDGAAYHQDVAKDRKRDARLQALGWTVYRIPGWVCRTESDPETGRLGKAGVEVRRIVLRHRITRGGGLLEMLHEQLRRYELGDAAYEAAEH